MNRQTETAELAQLGMRADSGEMRNRAERDEWNFLRGGGQEIMLNGNKRAVKILRKRLDAIRGGQTAHQNTAHRNKRKTARKKRRKSANKKIGRMEIRPTHVYFTNMKNFSVIYPPIVPPVRIYFRLRI